MFEVLGLDESAGLVVKIYGRDAYDSQVVAKAWRALWYRDSDAAFTLTRLQQVEHEAFLLLRAAQQGVRVPSVVTAGKTPDNDALLVLHAEGMALQDVPLGRISVELLERAWQTVALLHEAGIVHGNLDGRRLAVTAGGDIVISDLTSARVATTNDGRRSDFAQLFVVTALSLGETKAVEIATAALGSTEFVAVLPYVQDAALGSELRRAAKAADVDIDAVRTRVAAAVDVELAAPVRLRRVTRRGIIGVLLLAVAAYALLSSLSGLDLRELADQIRGAAWGWLVLGLIIGQTPRLTQAASTRAASPKPIPFGPIAVLQLAISFINLAVPSTVGRVAVSVRFFQRQGLRAATALSIGALDSIAGFIVQMTVLLLAFATGFGALDLEFNRSSDSGGHRIVVALVVVVLLAVATVACVPRWRHAAVNAIRDAASQVRETVTSLTLSQVAQLLLANTATEILFALDARDHARSLRHDGSARHAARSERVGRTSRRDHAGTGRHRRIRRGTHCRSRRGWSERNGGVRGRHLVSTGDVLPAADLGRVRVPVAGAQPLSLANHLPSPGLGEPSSRGRAVRSESTNGRRGRWKSDRLSTQC